MSLDLKHPILNFGLPTMGGMEAKTNAFWANRLPIQGESKRLSVSMAKTSKE